MSGLARVLKISLKYVFHFIFAVSNMQVFTSDNLLRVGFVDQVRLFLQQGRFLTDLDPESTLYLVAFGV